MHSFCKELLISAGCAFLGVAGASQVLEHVRSDDGAVVISDIDCLQCKPQVTVIPAAMAGQVAFTPQAYSEAPCLPDITDGCIPAGKCWADLDIHIDTPKGGSTRSGGGQCANAVFTGVKWVSTWRMTSNASTDPPLGSGCSSQGHGSTLTICPNPCGQPCGNANPPQITITVNCTDCLGELWF